MAAWLPLLAPGAPLVALRWPVLGPIALLLALVGAIVAWVPWPRPGLALLAACWLPALASMGLYLGELRVLTPDGLFVGFLPGHAPQALWKRVPWEAMESVHIYPHLDPGADPRLALCMVVTEEDGSAERFLDLDDMRNLDVAERPLIQMLARHLDKVVTGGEGNSERAYVARHPDDPAWARFRRWFP